MCCQFVTFINNNYNFQAEQIAFNAHQGFTIRKIADQNLLLKSEEFDFWAVYDTNTNIKIGVTKKMCISLCVNG